MDSDREQFSNENWQRAIDDDPVPKWVYGVQAIPVIGRVADVVTLVFGTIRARRDRKR